MVPTRPMTRGGARPKFSLEVNDGTWIVSFERNGLGFIKSEQKARNISTTQSGRNCRNQKMAERVSA
jgi:hypothetical protein